MKAMRYPHIFLYCFKDVLHFQLFVLVCVCMWLCVCVNVGARGGQKRVLHLLEHEVVSCLVEVLRPDLEPL